MMLGKTIAAAALTAALFAAPEVCFADEGGLSGNLLYKLCTDGNQIDSFGCLEFVTGWAQGVMVQAVASQTQPLFCLPEKIQYQQMNDVFVNYLRSHPEIRQKPATVLLGFAMRAAFPCGGK